MNPYGDPELLAHTRRERAVFHDMLRGDPDLAAFLGYPVAAANPLAQLNSKTLTLGSTGKDVEKLSANLNALGYYAQLSTSTYDEELAESVTRFQSHNGLSETGDADSKTVKAVEKAAKELEKATKAAEREASGESTAWESFTAGLEKGVKTKKRKTRKAQEEADAEAARLAAQQSGASRTTGAPPNDPMKVLLPVMAVGAFVVIMGGILYIATKD